MKKRKALFPLIALSIVTAFGLVACNNGGGENKSNKEKESNQQVQSSGEDTSEGELEEIKITAADNKTEIFVGETVQLSASVEGVTWKSRATSVATVSETGLVTGISAGTVKIRAEKEGYEDGSISITVSKVPEREWKYSVRLEEADHYDPDDFWGMDLSAYGYGIIGPGDSPIESNNGATDDGTSLGYLQQGCKETMTFTSDKAATVELGVTMAYNAETALEGVISVKFNGTAISMANRSCEGPEDGNDQNYYDFHAVSFGNVNLVAGNNVLEIEILGQVAPNMDKVVIWTEETLVITSVPAPQKQPIVVTPTEKEILVDETVQLVTETTGVTYESSAPTVATVSATGLVTGVSMGKATITVSKEGMKKATVVITVKAKPVAGQIVLEAEDAVLPEGTSIQLENGDNCSGGKSLGYFSAEQTFEIKFNATEAKKYNLSVVMSSATLKSDWSGFDEMTVTNEVMTMKFNNVAIDLGTQTLPGSTGWTKTWKEVSLGEVTTIVGENVFSFAAITQGPNIDCIKLTDPDAAVVPPPVEKVTVSFDANGGTGTMANVEVDKGSEYTLPANGFTAPENKEFAGWEIPSANWWEQAQVKQPGDKVTVSANLALKASWKNTSVTISFDANGGTGTMDPVNMKPGEYELPANGFTAPGTKVFGGWEVTTKNQWGQQQTQIKQAGEKINVADNMTIKANWKINIVKSEQVDLASAFVMEAEEATIAGAQTQQGGSPVESNESSHGGKDVGYMSKDATITFNFTASAAGQVKLVLMGRSASADWSNWQNPTYYDHALEETTSIKVNGADVDVTGKGFLGSDAKTSVQVDLGNIAVVEGANTIVITALAQAPNIDCIALIAGDSGIVLSVPQA